MNKEFRVWDAFQHKMSYGSKNEDLTVAFTSGKLTEVSLDDNERCCRWSAVPIDLERANRYFPQQYTGLTDSTGKKIFEGDIVCEKITEEMAANGESANVGRVFFAAGTFMIDGDGPLYEHVYSLSPDRLEDYLVIGNIFENPELLK